MHVTVQLYYNICIGRTNCCMDVSRHYIESFTTMAIIYPNIDSLYLDDSMYFIFEIREVPSSIIHNFCNQPINLLKLQLEQRRVYHLNHHVCL